MGRSGSFICHTCKKIYYLGYGSYSTWIVDPKDEEEFNEKAKESEYNDIKNIDRNYNTLTCLREHKGHDFEYTNDDYESSLDLMLDLYSDKPETKKYWEGIIENLEKIHNIYEAINLDTFEEE